MERIIAEQGSSNSGAGELFLYKIFQESATDATREQTEGL